MAEGNKLLPGSCGGTLSPMATKGSAMMKPNGTSSIRGKSGPSHIKLSHGNQRVSGHSSQESPTCPTWGRPKPPTLGHIYQCWYALKDMVHVIFTKHPNPSPNKKGCELHSMQKFPPLVRYDEVQQWRHPQAYGVGCTIITQVPCTSISKCAEM